MDLGVILPRERIEAMRAEGVWRDELILDHLERALARDPGRPAIVTYNGEREAPETLSVGDFDRLTRRIALALLDLGLGAGDVISVQLPNWWQFAALHVAANRIGAITNPLMPIFRERELEYMLGFAETRLVVAPARFRGFDYRPMYAGLKAKLPALEHLFFIDGEGETGFEQAFLAEPRETAADAAGRLAACRPGPDDVYEIIYTSGTTGMPKGVMHTPNSTLGTVSLFAETLSLGREDVMFMASPLAHQTGFLYGILMPLICDAPVIYLDRWQPPLAAEIIARHRCTWTMGATPFVSDLVHMPNVGDFDLSSLKIFVSAGAPIPPPLVQHVDRHFGFRLLSGWGMTECACTTLCRLEDPPERAWTSDGRPLPVSEIAVFDENGRMLPAGEEGALKVRGHPLFVGYLKKPELHGTDAEGWFDTGDIARIDDEGYVRISGRSKDIIIRGGENVPVVEIETLLYRHPAVQDAAVVGMPDPRLGERGCAFVTLNEGASLDFEGMIAWLQEAGTARQYLPEHLEVVAEMPRTPSGKIQKFVLRRQAESLAPDAGVEA